MASLYSSPAFAALPTSARLFVYDDDGDVRSGSPVRYPGSPVAPWAPERQYDSPEPLIQEGEISEIARNLAEEMAEVVLDDREVPPFIYARMADNPNGPQGPPPGPLPHDLPPIPPPGGEAAEEQQDQGWGVPQWCVSVNVSDLALRLDMRHPRVILNFLRFVNTYNELAPPGEEIYLPAFPESIYQHIVSHPGVAEPVPEFYAEVAELRYLLNKYRCWCPECEQY